MLIAGEVVLGVAVLALAARGRVVPSALTWLRRAHTGSVNDYAAFVTIGMLVVGCVLLV